MKIFISSALGLMFAASALAAGSEGGPVFTDTQSWGRADVPCLYAHGGCDVDQMEAALQTQCYSAGYSQCTTLIKSKEQTNYGSDPFCGNWYTGSCIVTVKGSK